LVSERRACTVVGQPRSTQRLPAPQPSDEELALRAFLRDFARRRPRWGWRRAARAARDAGWRVNDKRIHRLWRDEGLRVPYRKKQRPLRGIGVGRSGPSARSLPTLCGPWISSSTRRATGGCSSS
jgi:putative transposase